MLSIPEDFSLFQDDLDRVAALPSVIWDELRDGRLFVTGGTGFFGMWMLESLLWANQIHGLNLEIVVLSRDPEAFLKGRGRHLSRHPALSFITGDILDFETPPGNFSHLLLFASEGDGLHSPDWPLRYVSGTVDGTRRLLDMAASCGARSVMMASSGAIYHALESSSSPFREELGDIDGYLRSQNIYSESKRMMEILLADGARRHGYRALIGRCFAFSGPYLPRNSGFAFSSFLDDALAGRDIIVKSDGSALRSYLYAADLMIWLLTILVRGESGRPYNVGSDEPVSIGDLAAKIARAAGGRSAVVIQGKHVPGQAPQVYLPDVTRSKAELGLGIAVSLDEGIKRSLAWLQRDRSLKN